MKLFFAHNSLPEYRLAWFKEMSKKSQVQFVITNPELAKKLYTTDGEKYLNDELDCIFLDNGIKGYKQLVSTLRKDIFDFYELPPIDSLGEFFKSIIILCYAKKNDKKIGYFWEKWEAPIKYQTLKMIIKNKILGVTARSIYRHADIIFSPGSKNREYFINNGVKSNKIVWIPDCCEIPSSEYKNIREMYNIPKEAKLFLYFGRIIKQKGLDVLIEAFGKLDYSERKKTFLLVVGDGPFREQCEQLSIMLNIDNIKFCGRVEPHDRFNYFNQCDIFVHPGTFYEGRTDVWGLTLNEAVQCGKIIISTDAVGSAYDLISNGKNGYIVKAGEINELQLAMLDILRDNDLPQKAKLKNKEIFIKYNSINMASKYIDGCKKAISYKNN